MQIGTANNVDSGLSSNPKPMRLLKCTGLYATLFCATMNSRFSRNVAYTYAMGPNVYHDISKT